MSKEQAYLAAVTAILSHLESTIPEFAGVIIKMETGSYEARPGKYLDYWEMKDSLVEILKEWL
jgi:hypothetical protein